MSQIISNKKALGAVNQLFVDGALVPVVSKYAPTANDRADLGTLWIQPMDVAGVAVNDAWVITSVIANVANWANISGGAAVFNGLTVNGPSVLNGALTVASAGNAVNISTDAVANATTIGNVTGASSLALRYGTGNAVISGAATSTLTLGAAATTGVLSLGVSTLGQPISIGTALNTVAQTISIGTGASAANSVVNILTGVATAGQQIFQVLTGAGSTAGVLNIGTGTAAHVTTIGSVTGAASTAVRSGTFALELTTAAPAAAAGGIRVTQGATAFRVLSGAGVPNNNLAIQAGDMYVRSDPAGATSRIYVSTGAGAWTNITMAA